MSAITPAYAAWEAHSMTALTGGRFELGIGPGLPRAVTTRTEEFGMPARTPGERLADVGETIDRLRELDDAMHTPVLVAAGGPRARALAAEKRQESQLIFMGVLFAERVLVSAVVVGPFDPR